MATMKNGVIVGMINIPHLRPKPKRKPKPKVKPQVPKTKPTATPPPQEIEVIEVVEEAKEFEANSNSLDLEPDYQAEEIVVYDGLLDAVIEIEEKEATKVKKKRKYKKRKKKTTAIS